MGADDSLPDDVNTLKAMLRAERAARLAAEAEAQARTLLIEKLKLTIKKLRHEQFGQSSERGALLDQLELQLADLEENAAQAETAAQVAAAETIMVPAFERRKPARRPLPAHLPRERIVYPAPSACPCCGDSRLRKIGEDVTETLELIPRQWKVIQHVREKFSSPGLRSDHPAAGALASDRARARRPQAARSCAVRQVWPAPAAQSPERRL
jgi:transposase